MIRAVLTGWSTVSGFDLAWFSSLSSERLSVFSLHGAMAVLKFVCLYPSLYLLVAEPGGIGPWPGWLTIVLQCCDTVCWVISPIKSSPKWPIMCRVGRQTLLNRTRVSGVIKGECWASTCKALVRLWQVLYTFCSSPSPQLTALATA